MAPDVIAGASYYEPLAAKDRERGRRSHLGLRGWDRRPVEGAGTGEPHVGLLSIAHVGGGHTGARQSLFGDPEEAPGGIDVHPESVVDLAGLPEFRDKSVLAIGSRTRRLYPRLKLAETTR
jgi:hypothetical protein